MWKLGPGVVAFVIRLDQGEIGMIEALDRNWSTAGHKRKIERFVVFTRMNLFLKKM